MTASTGSTTGASELTSFINASFILPNDDLIGPTQPDTAVFNPLNIFIIPSRNPLFVSQKCLNAAPNATIPAIIAAIGPAPIPANALKAAPKLFTHVISFAIFAPTETSFPIIIITGPIAAAIAANLTTACCCAGVIAFNLSTHCCKPCANFLICGIRISPKVIAKPSKLDLIIVI